MTVIVFYTERRLSMCKQRYHGLNVLQIKEQLKSTQIGYPNFKMKISTCLSFNKPTIVEFFYRSALKSITQKSSYQ